MYAERWKLKAVRVQKAQPMKIYAGAGHMDFDSHPRYFVKDSVILAEHDGWAKLRFKVKGTPGKYLLPVRFEYEVREVIKTDTQYLEYIIEP